MRQYEDEESGPWIFGVGIYQRTTVQTSKKVKDIRIEGFVRKKIGVVRKEKGPPTKARPRKK